MNEDLKKALSYTAVGALFTLVNFNLTFNGATVNVMPDFVGWILFYLACGKLGPYLSGREWLKPASLMLVILSLAVWLGGFMTGMDISIINTVITVISAVFMFVLFGPLESIAREGGSQRADTIHTLKYVNLITTAVLLIIGGLIMMIPSMMNALALLFAAVGLAALAAAIVTVVVLFKLKNEFRDR